MNMLFPLKGVKNLSWIHFFQFQLPILLSPIYIILIVISLIKLNPVESLAQISYFFKVSIYSYLLILANSESTWLAVVGAATFAFAARKNDTCFAAFCFSNLLWFQIFSSFCWTWFFLHLRCSFSLPLLLLPCYWRETILRKLKMALYSGEFVFASTSSTHISSRNMH